MKTSFRLIVTCAALFCLGLLGACAPQQKTHAPLPELSVGVAAFSQPEYTVELLAGYIPEEQGKANLEALMRLDTNLRTALGQTKRSYTFLEPVTDLRLNKEGEDKASARRSALNTWATYGTKSGVDLLIVPMVIDWHERQGSEAGVTTSAAVTIDMFLIDCRGDGNLLQRSFYSEKQTSLSSNLLNIGTFFKRGGKWITAEQLSQEAIEKAIQEFGL